MTLPCRARRSLGHATWAILALKRRGDGAVVDVRCIFSGVPDFRRLADVPSGRVGLEEVWQEPSLEPKMFPVVPVPPDSRALLSPKRFSESLDRVRQRFDYVVLRTSSGLVSDATILAMQGGTYTFRCASRQSIRNPEAAEARVIGTILNVGHSRLEYC
jgi:hypothetical protein